MAITGKIQPNRTEIGYCFLCGAIVEVFTRGALDFGQVFERCTNRCCILAEPHVCRPDPTAPTPATREEAFSRTPEYRRLRRERAGNVRAPDDREVPIPGIALDFMRI